MRKKINFQLTKIKITNNNKNILYNNFNNKKIIILLGNK